MGHTHEWKTVFVAVCGSSPPTWGIRCSTAPTIDISRFIPTYVGHTAFGPQNAPAGSVHPHTRGAYTGSSRNVNSKIGSSPHTWGIRSPYPAAVPPGRFIPTYVGHAYNRTRLYIFNPVHPHIRGAYVCAPIHTGSDQRFIPTYVGHTNSLGPPHHHPTVHPHIRGAYCVIWQESIKLDGSSPHTWGILRRFYLANGPGRFIPTYVGHTTFEPYSRRLRSVHPHIREAYVSSRCSRNCWSRFIPTYVGHTRHGRAAAADRTVHPHIRGAYMPCSAATCSGVGSSPHTWGILLYCCFVMAIPRFIPTYVGHTLYQVIVRPDKSVHPHIRGAYIF